MVEQQLSNFLTAEGYEKIPSNLPEFTIYFRLENQYVNVFHVIDCRKNLYITEDQYLHIKDKIKVLFTEKGISNVHILSLIISGDRKKAVQISGTDPFCWIIDPYEDRLIIYENQTDDFYGIRERLEYFLAHISSEEEAMTDVSSKTNRKRHISEWKIPYVTAAIVLINIIIFLVCTFTGDLLYNIGAFDAVSFLEKKEYYRILSSVFLHWDVNHLFSNMLVLYYLGEVVEERLGCVRYGILYILTGLCGNLVSLGYELYISAHISSVGASGAVFGIIGALLVLVIIHKGRLDQITTGRLIFMICYSLYSGFAGSDINNAAHIGGMVGGIITAFMVLIPGMLKDRMRRNGERYED